MPSVLTSAPFTKTTLTYTVQGAKTGVDANGNPTFATTTGTLTVLFAPYRFDQLRVQPGSDPKVIAGRGELIDPLTFPTGVGIGSRLTCTFNGYDCELVITNIIPNDLASVVDFGSYFAADLRVLP